MTKNKTESKSHKKYVTFKGEHYQVVDADEDLQFSITEEDVRSATCKDPGDCVVARSIIRAFAEKGLKNYLIEVEVGSRTTRIFSPGRMTRFKTPTVLRNGLNRFDTTGHWNLPPGDYVLMKLPPSDMTGARSHRANSFANMGVTKGKGKTEFKGRAIPSRNISCLISK